MVTPSASVCPSGKAAKDPIRVMVVDDALVIRGMLTRMLDGEADIDVVASAGDGERALAGLKRRDVDVVVLDIEMPRMNGIEALPVIVKEHPGIQVVMASTLTKRNAEISLKAMALGASDYITKPGSSGALRSAEEFQRDLVEKVRNLGRTSRLRRRRPSVATPGLVTETSQSGTSKSGTSKSGTSFTAARPLQTTVGVLPRSEKSIELRPLKPFRPDAIAIGSSTGGPQALMKMLKDLGPTKQPIFITQHMPPTFTTILAEHITRAVGRPCHEAEDGMAVQSGIIYLAPGDRHMLIKSNAGRASIELSQGPQENFCRPAVDPMLRSLSAAYRDKLLIAILTGMGSDGAKGGKICVDAGAQLIAQDEGTSVVWGMPGAAASAGLCGAILPLDKIGPELRRFAVEGGRP